MTPEDIRQAVLGLIASIAPEADLQRLHSDQPLREQIELDSMDWLNVIAGLHERVGVELAAAALGPSATLASIVADVAATMGVAPARLAATALPELASTRHDIKGTAVHVRPIRADDLEREAQFVRHLSTEARYQRFMVTLRELSPGKLIQLTDVDQVRHVALVATVERDGRQELVGVVRYIVDASGTGCEFAIALDDAWHGSGLAGVLMQRLLDIARARGLATMHGLVLASNTAMLKLARQLGFVQQRNPEGGDTVIVVRAL
jgi:RimJ/RimL family protein N-acetyltransferase/acyl carrier protein